ncbi:helix-turn-helix transcriptional regulator [Actinokineospora globicatena]|uniref:helix-turn-helix transcriptional regulator n=1 Tax=Actinokineospora globicatena TaxID=103729 RepID=UPI0020A46924|nr:DNA-binding response regulator [Actinokineospora globicatena]
MDPLPLYRRGVVEALASNEVLVEAPDDIGAWAARSGDRVVVLTLAAQADWVLLERLSGLATVIAVLDEDSDLTAIRALRLGAGSVVSRGASTAVMRRALDAVLAGDAVVPRSVVRELVSSSRPGGGEVPRLLEEEVRWLRLLASGTTIASLAATAGYSERAMYRLLNSVYDKLGVTRRTEALIKANAYGWLGPQA